MRRLGLFKRKKGASTVIFAISLMLILGILSVAVDIALVISEKASVVRAADAAVLAGAQELVFNRDNAESIAREYLQKNGIDPDNTIVKVSDDGGSICISAKKEVEYYFAKVLGYDKGNVSANATAKALPVTSVFSGVRPLAVENQVLNFGQRYILKEGAGNGNSGNYGLLALGGKGSSILRDNIINGYQEELKIGDQIETEPGVKNGPLGSALGTLIRSCSRSPKCTFESHDSECPRIVNIVVVDSLDVNGRKYVSVEGFASFFLEEIVEDGGHTEITGRYVRNLAQGELSEVQADYGLMGIKLSD